MDTTTQITVYLVQKSDPRTKADVITAVIDADNGGPLWACVGTGDAGAARGLTAAIGWVRERRMVVVDQTGKRLRMAA